MANLIDFIGNETDALDWIKKEGGLDQKINVIELATKLVGSAHCVQVLNVLVEV